jgi:hypothetical protein
MKIALLVASVALVGVPPWAKGAQVGACHRARCYEATISFPGDGGTVSAGPVLCIHENADQDCSMKCLVTYCEGDGGCQCSDGTPWIAPAASLPRKDGGK